jgi:transposase
LRLFVGDDWAEDHHDVELMDVAGRVLAKARLPEGIAGMARLHALLGEHLGDADPDEAGVLVGIETDRGPWVAALSAAGYEVFAVNPLQAAQYRKRHAVSAPRATPVTRMCSPTWSARMPTSCGLSLPTVRRQRRSGSSPGCTRR